MPRKPSKEVIEAASKHLDPKDVLNATINDMNDPALEKRLVESGLARYVEEPQK